MSPLWTAAEAAAATGGTAARDFTATGVAIDSRRLEPGDLFVALTDNRDGHEFVAQALAQGAAAALVSRRPEGVAADAPLLVVPDVLRGLEALGRAARARTSARVVAVTGSVGKTTTKEMLRLILAGQGRVHAAEASYNNHWGVPLTLARMPQKTDFAVIEIGMNHPGEIAPLARLARPDVVVVTSVAAAHLAAFPDVAAIAREKASIVAGLAPGGTAVFNADLETLPILTAAARDAAAKVVLFGRAETADLRLMDLRVAQGATIVRAEHAGAPLLFRIRSAGTHFAMNGLAALAALRAMGGDWGLGASDLGKWRPPAGRGARERIVMDAVYDQMAFDLIDDAYNANPASVAAALDLLAATDPVDGIGRVSRGRRIAILGDMLELGAGELSLHRAIADHPALSRVQWVHCVGPRMRALWEALPAKRRGIWTETAEAMVAETRHLVDAGDVVLVKGSKGVRVSLVVDALRKLGQVGAVDN